MRTIGLLVLLAGTVLGSGCESGDARASETRAAVVDSAVSIEIALEEFRRGVPRPAGLTGGFSTREELVRKFIGALEVSDTAALRRMVLQKDEFAWLYYPTTRFTRKPYELPAGLLWFQMQGQTEKGASLLLSERAGASRGYLGHDCRSQRREGENTVHGHCVVHRVVAAGDTVTDRLFGLIVERGGAHKFVSYANKLE